MNDCSLIWLHCFVILSLFDEYLTISFFANLYKYALPREHLYFTLFESQLKPNLHDKRVGWHVTMVSILETHWFLIVYSWSQMLEATGAKMQ